MKGKPAGLGLFELDPQAQEGWQVMYDGIQEFAIENHDLNLFQHGVVMENFFLVLGAGHIIGVLALWGAFGRGVELVANTLWFLPVFVVRALPEPA